MTKKRSSDENENEMVASKLSKTNPTSSRSPTDDHTQIVAANDEVTLALGQIKSLVDTVLEKLTETNANIMNTLNGIKLTLNSIDDLVQSKKGK